MASMMSFFGFEEEIGKKTTRKCRSAMLVQAGMVEEFIVGTSYPNSSSSQI
ncbi:MAG TPA: hypothetical protein VJ729_01700 [Nitrososphaeraceae archaeon]|nr:hypothetical protein [Nitrososphaeraceae archaeon]